MSVTLDAGVITQAAIDAVAKRRVPLPLILLQRPLRPSAERCGKLGGPFASNTGHAGANLLSWRMVMPTGEPISIEQEPSPPQILLPGRSGRV